MNLPNRITLFRIILIPFMLLIPIFPIHTTFLGINLGNIILLIVFLIASFTDFWDGYLARKKNMVTDFGKFLDPIADKLLVLTAFIMLVERGIIPAWIPVLILTRELIVSGIRMIAAGNGNVIAASMLGKIKTVSQMTAISLAFLSNAPFFAFIHGNLMGLDMVINVLMSLAMIVSIITTVWSGLDYFTKSKDLILRSK